MNRKHRTRDFSRVLFVWQHEEECAIIITTMYKNRRQGYEINKTLREIEIYGTARQ